MKIIVAMALVWMVGLMLRAADARGQDVPGFHVPERWQYTAPLISPEKRDALPSHAQKDPTIVYHEGKWHVFMTVKLPDRSVIEYCSFEKWEEADAAPRTLLNLTDTKYFCAPQVFYFRPHRKWYLVYQVGGKNTERKMMWVAYSTTTDISDPTSWSQAKPMLDGSANDPRTIGGLDYWIICDQQRAYLFFTSCNGKMWRMWTDIDKFPAGFDHCELVLTGKIFEASHTYRLADSGEYLTIIEENGKRHYKAYIADALDGKWQPVAVTEDKPFAGDANIQPAAGVERWTDNVSHGELVRQGVDETMTIDPANLRFVFQGMLNSNKGGKGYGAWQWRIGLLTPAKQ